MSAKAGINCYKQLTISPSFGNEGQIEKDGVDTAESNIRLVWKSAPLAPISNELGLKVPI